MKVILTQKPQESFERLSRTLPIGTLFRTIAGKTGRLSDSFFLRVKPTGFILNSNVIADIMSRGDILVYNLSSDCIHAMRGDIGTVVCSGHFVVTDEAA